MQLNTEYVVTCITCNYLECVHELPLEGHQLNQHINIMPLAQKKKTRNDAFNIVFKIRLWPLYFLTNKHLLLQNQYSLGHLKTECIMYFFSFMHKYIVSLLIVNIYFKMDRLK
jgi:hypothetical protein